MSIVEGGRKLANVERAFRGIRRFDRNTRSVCEK